MNSDSSPQSAQPPSSEDNSVDSEGASIFDFPVEEVSSPGAPMGTWADDVDENQAQPSKPPANGREPAEVVNLSKTAPESAPSSEAPSRNAQTVTENVPSAESTNGVEQPKPNELQHQQGTVEPTPLEQRTAETSATSEPSPAAKPIQPTFLASKLLLTNPAPINPLPRLSRWGATGLGAGGMAGVLALGALHGQIHQITILLCLLFGGVIAVGIAPINRMARAVGLCTIGWVGVGLVGWVRLTAESATATPLLGAGLSLLISALAFRSTHQRSRFARTLVAVAITGLGTWFVLTGGLVSMQVTESAWQAWLAPSLRWTLALWLVLTTLTFLDPVGHGGGWFWATGFVLWLIGDVAGNFVLAQWPLEAATREVNFGASPWVSRMALPFLVMISAIGLNEIWLQFAIYRQHSQPQAAKSTTRTATSTSP